MNSTTYLYPAPWCPLPITHQARAYTKSEDTDVRRTMAEHRPDDYDLTDRDDRLSTARGFK